MTSEFSPDNGALADALAMAGRSEPLRNAIFEALRQAQQQAEDPAAFRDKVRWPLIVSLLREAKKQRVVLNNGLVFEVSPDSRIEQALLLSSVAHPDHVWEPQTTKLLTQLAQGAAHIIVGGAYIGDHALPLARAVSRQEPAGIIHAFEPADEARRRLVRNLEINDIHNVIVHRLGLWDSSDIGLTITGRAPVASSIALERNQASSAWGFPSITIDDYVREHGLASVGLIMLDTEGGEERALRGANTLLSRPPGNAPNLVFEIHRHFVDWSNGLENTAIVQFLMALGYSVFAIRDFHDNYPMAERPVEIIPIARVCLEGPAHGFNLIATKDSELIARLGLRMVENVNPKLLLHKDPALHHPLS